MRVGHPTSTKVHIPSTRGHQKGEVININLSNFNPPQGGRDIFKFSNTWIPRRREGLLPNSTHDHCWVKILIPTTNFPTSD